MQTKKTRNTAAMESLRTMSKTEECVVKELLRMGASFVCIGDYYIRDCIVTAIDTDINGFKNIMNYTSTIKAKVAKKYGIDEHYLWVCMGNAIDRMLCKGDFDYIVDVFKGNYDPERQKVTVNPFILIIAEKVRADIAKQYRNANYFRNKIKESVENITDPTLLNGIYNIMISLKGGANNG